MRFLYILCLLCCLRLNGQLTISNDSTKIVIYDGMGIPVPHAKVRINGIEFTPFGKNENGVYCAPIAVMNYVNHYSKCFVEVFHPDYFPYADSVFAMYPVMLSHGDTHYIYEINKRFVSIFEDLTILFNPDQKLLESLLKETSGSLFATYDPCEGNMHRTRESIMWLVQHPTREDQLNFRLKWKDQSFAVVTFDQNRSQFQALTREVMLDARNMIRDAEAISLLLLRLESEGRIGSWQFAHSGMQYRLILPVGQEFNGSALIEELVKTPYFISGSQLRTIAMCLD